MKLAQLECLLHEASTASAARLDEIKLLLINEARYPKLFETGEVAVIRS